MMPFAEIEITPRHKEIARIIREIELAGAKVIRNEDNEDGSLNLTIIPLAQIKDIKFDIKFE